MSVSDPIIFCFIDWDDTLLPLHALQTSHEIYNEKEIQYLFAEHEQKVINLLNVLTYSMAVCIVTNAYEGWVENSSNRYMPNVVPLLKHIPILSARQYETKYPSDPTKWKMCAFDHLTNTCGILPHKIISIGDSFYEIDACREICRNKYISQTIKLLDRPSLYILTQQLDFLTKIIPILAKERKSFDKMFTFIASHVPNVMAIPKSKSQIEYVFIPLDIEADSDAKQLSLISCSYP